MYKWAETRVYSRKRILISSTPQKKIYKESLLKQDPVRNITHPHHPTNSLELVGDSLACYLFLTSFNNSNPYQHNCASYIRLIHV